MIIAVDFDGTLVEDAFPEIGEPKEEIISWVKRQKKLGHKIILWTSRNKEHLTNAIIWCEKNGLEFDSINCNIKEVQDEFHSDTRKVLADIYLDDKALNPMSVLDFGGVVVEQVVERNRSSKKNTK